MKLCKNLLSLTKKTPTLGGPDQTHTAYECGLKNQSQEKEIDIYQALFKLGYQGSVITSDCPFVTHDNLPDKDNFAKCPFRE
jgi:hypothetical protein